jgi:hypothetical protein
MNIFLQCDIARKAIAKEGGGGLSYNTLHSLLCGRKKNYLWH